MPVILRLCVEVETIVTHAPLLSSSTAVAGAEAQKPSPASPAATPHPSASAASPRRAHPRSQGKSLSHSKDASTPQHSPRNKNPFRRLVHWFRRHKKTSSTSAQDGATASPKKGAGSSLPSTAGATAGDGAATVASSAPASVIAKASGAATGKEGDASTGATALPSAETTAPPPSSPLSTNACPSTAASTAAAAVALAATAPPQVHRSLVWLSLQVTPATTVKSILQQIQEMVEQRMGARLCEVDTCPRLGTSVTTSPTGSFATTSPPQQHPHGTGSTPHAPDKKRQSLAPTPPANSGLAQRHSGELEEEEWCLCLQDSEGMYRWVGSTRHYAKTSVLRAPFLTDVCLRSHAAFEAERQLSYAKDDPQQHGSQSLRSMNGVLFTGSSPLPSPTGGTRTSRAVDLSGTLLRDPANATSHSVSSASSSSRSPSGPTEDRRGGGSGHRWPSPFPHGNRSTADKKSRKGKKDKTSHKSTAVAAKAAELFKRHGEAAMTPQKFTKPTQHEIKFAFLKGVLVPMAVLKFRNPFLTHHRSKSVLYTEVRVPRAMQLEPLDAGTEPAAPALSSPLPPVLEAASATPSERKDREASEETSVDVNEQTIRPLSRTKTSAPSVVSQPGGSEATFRSPHDTAKVSVEKEGSVEAPSRVDGLRPASSTGPEEAEVPPAHLSQVNRPLNEVNRKSFLRKLSSPTISSATSQPTRSALVEDGHAKSGVVDGVMTTGDAESCASLAKLEEVEEKERHTHAVSAPPEEDDLGAGGDDHRADAAVPSRGPFTDFDTHATTQGKNVEKDVLARLTGGEDAARLGLTKAQADHHTALAAYREIVPPTPEAASGNPHPDPPLGGESWAERRLRAVGLPSSSSFSVTSPLSVSPADAALTALLQRRIELRTRLEEGRRAERQCERLTTLAECLEKELREREERCALLALRVP